MQHTSGSHKRRLTMSLQSTKNYEVYILMDLHHLKAMSGSDMCETIIHWGIKKLHSSHWYNNFAKLCHTMMILAHRCTWEYHIACLFDSLCKIDNWEPPYQICYCLLSSRQQCKMWNSCCNATPQTSLLQTYGLLTVLTLILWITGLCVSTAVTCLLEIC